MVAVAMAEAKAKLSELVKLANAGEEVTITSRGKPVARLVPQQPAKRPIDLSEFEAIAALSEPWKGEGSYVVWLKEQDLL